jgi:hypothetical protein
MKSTNSSRLSSVQSVPAWRTNTTVSATVIDRVRVSLTHTADAYFHDGHRGRRLLVHSISVCHGVGGMFAASGTIIFSNRPPWGVVDLEKRPKRYDRERR